MYKPKIICPAVLFTENLSIDFKNLYTLHFLNSRAQGFTFASFARYWKEGKARLLWSRQESSCWHLQESCLWASYCFSTLSYPATASTNSVLIWIGILQMLSFLGALTHMSKPIENNGIIPSHKGACLYILLNLKWDTMWLQRLLRKPTWIRWHLRYTETQTHHFPICRKDLYSSLVLFVCSFF